MTKDIFWGIIPPGMYTRETILKLIEDLRRERNCSLRKLAADAGIPYDTLKDYCQRKTRQKTQTMKAHNLQKLLALKGKSLKEEDKSKQELHIILTLEDLNILRLRKSPNILLQLQFPPEENSQTPLVAVELSPSESRHLAQLLNSAANDAEISAA